MNDKANIEPKQHLRTEGLVKVYDKRQVVSNVSIDVFSGEVVGLLGPNGAGKTTTFYMVVGLIKPLSGKIFFNEKDITGLPMYKRAQIGIGYLPQESSIFRKLSVEDNILAILEMLPLTAQERMIRLEDLLQELKINHVRKSKGYMLSGGERRRAEITRTLVTSPSFILLDEPFAGVDPIAVLDIQDIISELRKKGIGILITDHNVRETLEITDRSYIMNEGQILVSGSKAKIIDDPIARKIYLGEKFTM
ncbi:LPS export ABC transporter ATP-binding protein [Candidatus Dependentiae bacterium]|nr:LPS export ABC transporter ATP-binding protein [Candidatus Dependentiae bacterium]